MDFADIKNKTDKELAELSIEKREAQRVGRFARSGAASGNVKAACALRKDIARILTLENARAREVKSA